MEDIPGSVYHIPSGDLKQDNFNIFKFSPELREILFQHYIAVNAAEIDFIGIVPEDVTTEMIGLTDSTRVGLVFAVNEVLKTVNHISRNADIEYITF